MLFCFQYSNISCLCFSVIPNCQFRSKTSRLKTFTANQLDEIKDPSGLFYILPFQKVRHCHHRQTVFAFSEMLPLSCELSVISLQGYLVNWDVQRKVWDHLFGKEMFKVYILLHSHSLSGNILKLFIQSDVCFLDPGYPGRLCRYEHRHHRTVLQLFIHSGINERNPF